MAWGELGFSSLFRRLRHRQFFFCLRNIAALGVCLLVIGFLTAAPQGAVQTPRSGARPSRPDIIFVQAPTIAARNLADRFPQGSRLIRLQTGSRPNPPAILTPEFFAAADPQVSFDGAKVLFSGRKVAAGQWQVWEMSVDGLDKRKVTNCTGDCLRPAYLPGNEIVYTAASQETGRLESRLVVSKGDGSQARRITFGPGDFQVETVLRDGRILASADWPLVATTESKGSRLLYTLKPDGTALESLRCEHGQAAVRGEAEELDDGSIVFVKSEGAGEGVGGGLAEIRRGSTHNTPLGPRESMAWSARQWGADELIVARRSALAGSAMGRYDLYTFNLNSGTFGNLVYRAQGLSSIQAVPVVAHSVPKVFWSLVNPAAKSGYLISLDSGASADSATGHFSELIARVRVLTLEGASRQERSLGEAPVERDGSFYVAVPPDQPVRFELLDAEGRIVHAQRSWIWARPGEERGCPGCHEDKAVAPENRWPLTLKRFDTPTPLGAKDEHSATEQ
jgi:Hydrazine synthase alpha subunit middle domain